MRAHILLAALAAAAAPACGAGPAAPLSLPHAAAAAGALESAVALDRAAVTPGERMHVTVRVTNVSARPVAWRTDAGCELGFVVLAADGSMAAPFGRLCTFVVRTVRLAPGASLEQTFPWEGARMFLHGGEPLPPGSYAVVGGVGPGPELWAPSAPAPLTVTAAP